VSPLVTGLDRGKLTSRGGPVPLEIARFMMGNSHGSASVDRALADLATLEHNRSKISSTLDGKDATTSMLDGKDVITPNLPAVSKVGQELNSSDEDDNAMEVSFVENNDRSQSPTATFAELEQQGDETVDLDYAALRKALADFGEFLLCYITTSCLTNSMSNVQITYLLRATGPGRQSRTRCLLLSRPKFVHSPQPTLSFLPALRSEFSRAGTIIF